jgi:signal transduction histidine kinase/CheY-like chemotaxis protein
MLVAALLPIGVVMVALVGLFWMSRVDDITVSYAQRGRQLLQQTALASEFGLFAGNIANLQDVVNAVQRETSVHSVAVFNPQGAMLVRAGGMDDVQNFDGVRRTEYVARQQELGIDTLFQPILSKQVELNDLFSTAPSTESTQQMVLGYAVVEMSRQGIIARKRDILILSVIMGLVGLLVGGVLAVRLGEGVVRPILRVSRMIEKIGKGDLASRLDVSIKDPMFELQTGLNQMAMRLQWGREELEQRVREATRELSARKEEAEAATLAKSRFLAAASHDLRQPTHAMGMFIARLGQLPLDAQTRKLVGNLEASVQAMQELLDSFLDISRLDVGSVPIHVSSFALQGLFDSLETSLAPVAAAKGLRLRFRPTPCWVRTDAALLQRMVMNLAHNALRYTERGSILIACRPSSEAGQVRLEVRDSGIGIAPEHQGNIFKEFFQVGNAGRNRHQGLGLGLNIVERSAHLLGLPLSMQSMLGRGTRFTLVLPFTDPVADSAASGSEVLPLTVGDDLAGVHVLVIEDDAFAREAIYELLDSWGCQVSCAEQAAQAVTMVEAGLRPSVLVSDYRLGDGLDGLRLIGVLRELVGYHIAACLMSGDTDSALIQAAQQAGLILLHKPVRPAKLRSLLRRLVKPSNTSPAPLTA